MWFLIQSGAFYLQGENGWGGRDAAMHFTRPNALSKCAWLVKQGQTGARVVPEIEERTMRVRRARR